MGHPNPFVLFISDTDGLSLSESSPESRRRRRYVGLYGSENISLPSLSGLAVLKNQNLFKILHHIESYGKY